MKLLLLGTPQDARGFALAGVEARVCGCAAELEKALQEAERAPAAMVAVSAAVAELAPSAVRAYPGALIVLPRTPP